MMKILILLAAIGPFCKVSYGQTWDKVRLGSKVSVDFPVEPESDKWKNLKTYRVIDTAYAIVVIAMDFSEIPGVDIKSMDLDSFYIGFLKGTLDAAGDVEVLDTRRIKIGNYEAQNLVFIKKYDGGQNAIITQKSVLIGEVMYSFDVWDMGTCDIKEMSKRFFDSIVVKN